MYRHPSYRVFTTKRESGKEIPILFSRTSVGRKAVRGFTLIEVTVAIFIIGIIIIASTMLLRAAQVNRVTQDEDIALKIANNEVGVLRAGGYAALPASGSFTNSLLSMLPSGAAAVTISSYDAKTKKADVSVSWLGPDNATHAVALTTLITETGGL
jgi:prepilin-type N-terminal cleavage/methylation domain-containing protein